MKKVIEKKHLLNGNVCLFECELIYQNHAFGILKYVLEKQYQVADLILPKGTITYAFYWIDRPYSLYRWFDDQKNIGNYFNIADGIKLSDIEFQWRDLVIDILSCDGGDLRILDREELPAEISISLHHYIMSALNLVIDNNLLIIEETDGILRDLGCFKYSRK